MDKGKITLRLLLIGIFLFSIVYILMLLFFPSNKGNNLNYSFHRLVISILILCVGGGTFFKSLIVKKKFVINNIFIKLLIQSLMIAILIISINFVNIYDIQVNFYKILINIVRFVLALFLFFISNHSISKYFLTTIFEVIFDLGSKILLAIFTLSLYFNIILFIVSLFYILLEINVY